MPSRNRSWFCAGLALLVAAPLKAQIFYTRATGADQANQLWQMDPDGSNERIVAVNLPGPSFPRWSPDGRFLSLSSPTPGRPNKLSWDVFTFDPITGQVTTVVPFQDEVVTRDLPTGGTELRSGFVLPLYEVLSPDHTRLAVWQFARVAVTQNGTPSGTSTTPVLQVFRTADGILESTQILNRQLTGFTTGGDGVDWHPTQNLMAAAIDLDVPVPNAGPAEGCAIFLMEPANDPLHTGHGRQLTHPNGYLSSTLFQTVNGGESDFAPAFSPNGQELAYFRCLTLLDSNYPGYRRPCQLSLRIVGVDGSNDRQILAFQPGIFATQVSWSPDGQSLAFDAGSQLVVEGTPANAADPSTTRISLVHRDGSNPHPLTGTGRYTPAWRPGGGNANPGRLAPRLLGNGKVQFTIEDLPAGAQGRVDVTGDLRSWVPLQTISGTGNPITVTDPAANGENTRFYRWTRL